MTYSTGMRLSRASLGALLLVACVSETPKPPYLDHGVAPPIIPAAGGDGGVKDSGVFDGAAAALAPALNARGIALSGGYVYVANQNSGAATGTLFRVATLGAPAQDLVSNLVEPWAVVASPTHVTFSTVRGSDGNGAVYDVVLGASTATVLAASTVDAYGLATDATSAYFTDTSAGLGVERRGLNGSGAERLATSNALAAGYALRIQGSDLYVAASNGVVYHAPLGGGVLEPLDVPLAFPLVDLVVVGTTLFAALDAPTPNGAIVTFPKAGGPAKTYVGSLDHPARLATDGTRLYWTNPTAGTVSSVNLAGTPEVQTVAADLTSPYALAVADAVYVTTAASVMKLPK